MSRGGVSQQEFIAQFWSEMQKCVREGGKCTQVEVFNQLNAEFEGKFGIKRYSNFDSFRKVRDKSHK